MSNRLSHSQVNIWQDCPRKWAYRYKEKLYPTTIGASLVFGKAIDVAIEYFVQHKHNYKEALEKFNTSFDSYELNGETHTTKDSVAILYSNRDIDLDLVTEAGMTDVEKYINEFKLNTEGRSVKELIAAIQKQKDIIGYNMLSKERKIVFNVACYYTLKTKGELMLKAFKMQILPHIKDVVSVQEAISIKNESGDEITGLIDAVLKWDDIPEPIVFDFKTSARPYEDDSVKTSTQLSVYMSAVSEKYKTRKAGYIVMSKSINKNKNKVCSECGYDGTGGTHRTCPEKDADGNRCGGEWKIGIDPQCIIQVIIDDLPEATENLVMENMDAINTCINNNIFSRNLTNCMTRYNTLCPYYEICYKNDYKDIYRKEDK